MTIDLCQLGFCFGVCFLQLFCHFMFKNTVFNAPHKCHSGIGVFFVQGLVKHKVAAAR